MNFGFLRKSIQDKQPIVYDGRIENITKCLSIEESKGYWQQYPEDFKLTKFFMSIYGKNYTFFLPAPPIGGWKMIKTVKNEFIDYVTRKSHDGYYTDIELGILIEMVRQNNPMLIEVDGIERPIFVFVNEALYKAQEEIGKDPEMIEKFTTASGDLDVEAKLGLLSMKEFMMGYTRIDPFKYKVGGKEIDMHIGQSYIFEIMGERVRVPYNYTIALRKAMFSGIREPGQQLMRDFQYETILRECKETYECTLRRQGKTVGLAYRAERGMMRQGFEGKHNLRPSSVLYLSLLQATNAQVKEYMENTQRAIAEQSSSSGGKQVNMFRYDDKANVLRWGNADMTYGKCTFLSQQGQHPGVGLAGDLLIIDESFLIDDEVKKKLDPIVDIEGADYFSSSTMYEDSKRNFAWRDMILFERNLKHFSNIEETIVFEFQKFKHLADKEERTNEDKVEYASLVNKVKTETFDRVSLRYDIDKLSHISQAHKDKMKHKYLVEDNNALRYYTELYCRFPDEDSIFKLQSTKKGPEEIDPMIFEEIVSAIDPAMDQDQSGFVQIGRDPHSAKIVVFNAKYLRRTGMYLDQVNEIKGEFELSNKRHKLADMPHEITNRLGIDGTGQQKAIAEIFESNGLTCHVKFSWKGGTSDETVKNGWTRIAKSLMVGTLQACFENGWIIIDSSLKDLFEELKNYKKVGATRQAIQGTDDLVSALMMAVYVLYNKLSKRGDLSDSTRRVDPTLLSREELAQYNREKREKEIREQNILREMKGLENYFQNNIW